MDEANKYGVNYYMLKPINYQSLEKRILSLNTYTINNNMYMEEATLSDLLHKLGIPSHIRGYKYIRDGILIVYHNKNISYITKDVYPEIASKYNTTPTRVERAIRHAIEVSWNRGNWDMMEDIFGYSVSIDKAKPTNSEFIVTIADMLRLEYS
jgi:two-component system response regulator (stage 0 sporulation protein A)